MLRRYSHAMTPPRSIAVYARASRDPSEQRISVDRQLARCRAKADDLYPGAEVETFVDNDRSASDPDVTRPGYEALLGAIRRGEVAEVVVHEQSRLTRHPSQWDELVVTLSRAGITKIQTVQQGTIGVEAGNRLVGRIMNVIDAEESERIRARAAAAHDQLAKEGRPVGRSHYGYRTSRGPDGTGRPELVIVPEEAAIIRRIVDELLAGHSSRAVAERLNDDGIPTARGCTRWRSQGVLALARRPYIAGLRAHRGTVVGPARWEGVITPDRFEALSRALGPGMVVTKRGAKRRRVATSPGKARRWLLTGGIARCGICGAPMVAGPLGRGRGTAYFCRLSSGDPNACGRMSIRPAELVEEMVTEAVLDHLERPEVAARLAETDDPERQTLSEEIAAADARIARAAELFGAGEIDEETWRTMHAPAAARADSARARLRAMSPAGDIELPAAEMIRSHWAELPLAARQAVLRRLLVAVRIGPVGRTITYDARERVWQRLRDGLEWRTSPVDYRQNKSTGST